MARAAKGGEEEGEAEGTGWPLAREVPARREASLNGAKTMRFSTMCASVSTASVKKCEVPRQRPKSLKCEVA